MKRDLCTVFVEAASEALTEAFEKDIYPDLETFFSAFAKKWAEATRGMSEEELNTFTVSGASRLIQLIGREAAENFVTTVLMLVEPPGGDPQLN
jgi:hypothetical protein